MDDAGVEVTRYAPEDAGRWDAFVRSSRNGTFVLSRPYVDYHAHRFEDASVIARHRGRIVAVLPANAAVRDGARVLESHAGLTYGGWVVDRTMTLALMLDVFDALDGHLRAEGFSSVVYKPVPHVYHRDPAEEDLYALHLRGARTLRHDVSSVVDLRRPQEVSGGRRDGLRRARRAGLAVREVTEVARVHQLITDVLARRHGALPTHSLDELELLRTRFPQQVRVFLAEAPDGRALAGAVVYDCGEVVHTQYLANSDEGRRDGALDLVVVGLMRDVFPDRHYLSFGISTERGGAHLNRGLAAQKEMFGARSVTCRVLAYDLAPA